MNGVKLKYEAKKNRENNFHELRGKYILPLNDENVCNQTYAIWKKMVHDRVKQVSFFSHTKMCSTNTKTCLDLLYDDSLKLHNLQILNQKLLAWC